MSNPHLSKVIRTTKNHLNRLQTLGIQTVKDLILHFPRTYNDTTEFRTISDLRTDEVNTVKGTLSSIFNQKTKYGKKLTRAIFSDSTGSIEVVWFNQPHITRILQADTELILSGKAKFSFGRVSMQNPSFEFIKKNPEEQIHTGRIVPVYHETEGINSKWLRSKIKPLIEEWSQVFNEHLPKSILEEHGLMNYREAILNVHFPENEQILEKAKHRLAFDELFLLQLKILQKRWHWQNIAHEEAKQILPQTEVLKSAIEKLPFELTNAQKRTLKEILIDISKNQPMSRLVQGDVGSGKTVIAALSTLNTVKNGYQVAVMAPTEILAKQHYKTFMETLKEDQFNIQFLAGSTPKKQKENILQQMATGTVDIVIGTHALIQEGIKFKNLGLAIVDEQHRFGVKQRETLKSYGSPHLLTMTATPIPRTLAITIYGDQDLSIIDEMPKGRQEIITKLVPEKKRQDAYRWIEDQVNKGRQAFVICPLIDESDTLELKSVLQEYQFLQEHIFPQIKLGLLHGKMKQEEKDQIMTDFKSNNTKILVSTSVIEVGIDVPNATIMLIEGAERFGLSQLHQFRGRVGRGEHQSYCFLFTSALSEEGKRRMKAMEEHTSGFKLSEIDLELRGPGEVYGVRQSGIPDLKMASLSDYLTIDKARRSAQRIIEADPYLKEHPQLEAKIRELYNVYIED